MLIPSNPPKHSVETLGEYLVTEDIAEGTFGKVKSESLDVFNLDDQLISYSFKWRIISSPARELP